MPTALQISTTIRTRFNDATAGWPALQPTVARTFQGEEFDPPNDAPWVRLTIMGIPTDQVEFGNSRRFRRGGLVRVQFWLVAGHGSGDAFAYADSVKAIFEGRTIDNVRFFGTSIPDSEGTEGPWQRWRVDTPFDADELRAV